MSGQHVPPMALAEPIDLGDVDELIQRCQRTPTGCWEWQACLSGGYGRWDRDGEVRLAHRVAWELLRGEIPAGHDIHHRCRNRRCVNPEHLQPVSRAEHAKLEGKSTWTHCRRGHPFDAGNTNTWTDRNGYVHRQCRACNRERAKRRREAVR